VLRFRVVADAFTCVSEEPSVYIVIIFQTNFMFSYWIDGPGFESLWGRDFPHLPVRPWGPPSLLYYRYRVSFSEVELSGRGVDHTPRSNAEVKESVELYVCSPSGPSWQVIGRTLLFICGV
jgi:hypothetical protein